MEAMLEWCASPEPGVRTVPIYEYRCQECRRRVEVLVKTFSAAATTPACPRCGSDQLHRLVSRVTVIKSWGSSLYDGGMESLGDVDENDPQEMQGWMRRMRAEMGDDTGDLSEMDMLDLGIAPEDDHFHDPGDA